MCIANPEKTAGIEETLGSLFPLRGDAALPVARETPRRRKLWEIATRYHCPVIGTCLNVEELSKLTRRAGLEGWGSNSDYMLHSAAVGLADYRNELSDPMQKLLEPEAIEALIAAVNGMNNPIYRLIETPVDKGE